LTSASKRGKSYIALQADTNHRYRILDSVIATFKILALRKSNYVYWPTCRIIDN